MVRAPQSLKRGRSGLLHIYINRTLPQPLKIPCVVAGERVQDGERVAQLLFRDLSDAVVDMLEKLDLSASPTPRRRRAKRFALTLTQRQP